MLIGYARVSTEDQNLDLQQDALTHAGCERIFVDKASGVRTNPPGLGEALSHLRPGDSLVVWKLDRLGRSVRDLIEFVGALRQREINFRTLDGNAFDTGTAHGQFFFTMMAALAEMERGLIRERTTAGLAAARARGRLGGGPRTRPFSAGSRPPPARGALDLGDRVADLGVDRTTLYRALRRGVVTSAPQPN